MMRKRIYAYMLQTRGKKYRSFLRYLRFFKFIAFAPYRGAFLESYYVLMRYLDDVVDGDAPLPENYSSAIEYIRDKIAFSMDPSYPKDEADYLMEYCFQLGKKFRQNFQAETADILHSLLFDAERRNTNKIFSAETLGTHFHLMDIRGTIRATLKIFREDPQNYIYLEPLGKATRYQFDLEDLQQDIKAGYINITREDCEHFQIRDGDFADIKLPGIQKWILHHAQEGMNLLDEHHRQLKKVRFSKLALATFYLVYERPARKLFLNIISSYQSIEADLFYHEKIEKNTATEIFSR